MAFALCLKNTFGVHSWDPYNDDTHNFFYNNRVIVALL